MPADIPAAVASVRADLFARCRERYWRAIMGEISRDDFEATVALYCRLWHTAGKGEA